MREGEDLEEAARRELEEEVGITSEEIERFGIIEFRFKNTPDIFQVYVFRVGAFGGELRETEEMRPQWFAVSEIPYHEMWAADKEWLPLLFAGKKFRAQFFHEHKDSVLILERTISVVK